MPKKFNYPRNFEGIWIPKEIYLRTDLGAVEKLLLVEISSLDAEHGCYASNQYLANFLQVSLATLKRAMQTLLEKKLIKKEGRHNSSRVLRVELKIHEINEFQPKPKAQIEPQSNTSSSLTLGIPVSEDTVIPDSSAKPINQSKVVKDLIHDFSEAYFKRTGNRATINWPWWTVAFKGLRRDHSPEEIRKVMDRFFGYEKRTQFGLNKFQLAFDNLAPAALGHAPRTRPAFGSWKCPHCGEANTHTGSRCMRCKKDRDDKEVAWTTTV